MKIHIGCGKRNFGSGWFHVDGSHEGGHIDHHDIFKLPQKSDSVDLVYASHIIEYFDSEEVCDVLREWKRVLKPGGILRLAVPDFESMAELYVSKSIGLHQIVGPLYGKMNLNEKKIYHRMVYDFGSLSRLLTSLGLKNIKRYDWQKTEHASFDDHSQAYIPHMDKNNGTLISLNVECEK